MPANGRWDLIRRLKVNNIFSSQLCQFECFETSFVISLQADTAAEHIAWLISTCFSAQ